MATIPVGTKFLGVDPNFTDLTERKGTKVDRKSEYFSLEDITATVGVGSEGPQGVQGPAGPPGPVGPAGLEWQGAWNTNSSYAVNDAVGFNGASWFCISEVTGTGNSNPEEDTTHWALLAAQGATGPQGAQGPQGPQGAQGVAGTATLPYKEYVGYVQFSSDGNALNTEVFNDIESGIYFALNSTGVYVLNVYTSVFTTKTIISPFDRISGNPAGVRLPIFNNATGLIIGYYTINRWNSSSVRMHFWDTSNNLVNPYTLLGTRAVLTDIKIYN